jgi:hypothetical protein
MKDADKKVAPDETMIPDPRAGLSPHEMVQEKLLHALRARPGTPRAVRQKDASRRPARGWES